MKAVRQNSLELIQTCFSCQTSLVEIYPQVDKNFEWRVHLTLMVIPSHDLTRKMSENTVLNFLKLRPPKLSKIFFQQHPLIPTAFSHDPASSFLGQTRAVLKRAVYLLAQEQPCLGGSWPRKAFDIESFCLAVRQLQRFLFRVLLSEIQLQHVVKRFLLERVCQTPSRRNKKTKIKQDDQLISVKI